MGMDLETTKGRRRGGENERELIVINSLLTVLLLYTVIIFANDKLGNLGVISRVDNRPIKRTKRVEQANNILFTLNYFLLSCAHFLQVLHRIDRFHPVDSAERE